MKSRSRNGLRTCLPSVPEWPVAADWLHSDVPISPLYSSSECETLRKSFMAIVTGSEHARHTLESRVVNVGRLDRCQSKSQYLR
jgi:hypothetical protein